MGHMKQKLHPEMQPRPSQDVHLGKGAGEASKFRDGL